LPMPSVPPGFLCAPASPLADFCAVVLMTSAAAEISTLSLHDALPISGRRGFLNVGVSRGGYRSRLRHSRRSRGRSLLVALLVFFLGATAVLPTRPEAAQP